jgi:hypothetical protein
LRRLAFGGASFAWALAQRRKHALFVSSRHLERVLPAS